jgi:diaminopimelate epimerase
VTGTPTITWTVPPSEGEYVTSSVLEALHTSTGYQWQYANTGTHHLVTFLPTEDALAAADIDTPGLDVVRQSVCNANFVVITSPTSMTIRTFEKGVDAETGACGTGAAAACFLAQRAHLLPPGDPSDTSKCILVTTHAGTLLVQTTPAVGTDGGIRVTLGGTVDEIR